MRKFKNYIHLLRAIYWSAKCGFPGKKMYLIGVTGTDGKTTTATLIYEILKAAGFKVGLFSTVSVQYSGSNIRDQVIGKGLHTTNPGPEELQPILQEMLEAGVTHVVMEVTSHGLDQNRVWGCDFKIGVWTNLTHEHLDYHKSMQKYLLAKAKLMANVQYSILNKDDGYFEAMKMLVEKNKQVKIIGYGKTKLKEISPSLNGDYNKYNIAAATVVAQILNVQNSISNKVIKEFEGVPGRRQEVKNKKGFKVYVDFAHTPNALESVLKQLRNETKNKLIVVFGCTGERDKEKRPIMGEIAARLADVVIITSDDTRSESQDEIARQILSDITPSLRVSPSYNKRGTKGGDIKKVWVINDRREALQKALGLAKKGDIVVLAGKGHEKSILLGKTEHPWSDVEEASKIFRSLDG